MEKPDTLSGNERESEELCAYRYAEPHLKAVAEDWYLPETALSAGYIDKGKKLVIKLNTSVICRYKLSGKAKYLEIPAGFEKLFPDDAEGEKAPSGDFLRLAVESADDTKRYAGLLCDILDAVIFLIPKEFSCCHRCFECSDTLRCVHENREFAMGCYYKKVLKSGRVFYGKNRTE